MTILGYEDKNSRKSFPRNLRLKIFRASLSIRFLHVNFPHSLPIHISMGMNDIEMMMMMMMMI